MKRRNHILFSIIITLGLAGCATAIRVPALPSNYEAGANDDPIVIGSVSLYLTEGKPMKATGLFGERIPRMVTIENLTIK